MSWLFGNCAPLQFGMGPHLSFGGEAGRAGGVGPHLFFKQGGQVACTGCWPVLKKDLRGTLELLRQKLPVVQPFVPLDFLV